MQCYQFLELYSIKVETDTITETGYTTVRLLPQDSVCLENLPNTCRMPQRIYLTPLIWIYIKYWKVSMIYNSPSLMALIRFGKPGTVLSGETTAMGCRVNHRFTKVRCGLTCINNCEWKVSSGKFSITESMKILTSLFPRRVYCCIAV